MRSVARRLDADIRRIDYAGIAHSETHYTSWSHLENGDVLSADLGFIEARVVGSSWAFYVRLFGLRSSTIADKRDKIVDIVSNDTSRFIKAQVKVQPFEVEKPCQLSLDVSIVNGIVSTKSKLRRTYLFNTGSWWLES
jgi:hypothetical protein